MSNYSTARCGLYCPDCIPGNRDFFEAVKPLPGGARVKKPEAPEGSA